MDRVGGTIKNVIFRKVKSGHTFITNLEKFSRVTVEFVSAITTVYFPKEEEIEEPKDIGDSPIVENNLKMHKLERAINECKECSIKFYKTGADKVPFYTQWYIMVKKVGRWINTWP